jgi:hypothetical protein
MRSGKRTKRRKQREGLRQLFLDFENHNEKGSEALREQPSQKADLP